MGCPRVGLALALAHPHSAFPLSPPGVSTGNACHSMLFPTAASARMGTRGPCATGPGHLQTRVWACSACMVTARPWPPRGHTVCVILAFRASFVSKVRDPPPDMASPGSLPTIGISNWVFSSSQPLPSFCAPAAFLHLTLLSGFSAPYPLGSKSHPEAGPHSPAQLFLQPPYQSKCPCWLRSLLIEEIIGVTASVRILAHHLGPGGSLRVGDSIPDPPWSE